MATKPGSLKQNTFFCPYPNQVCSWAQCCHNQNLINRNVKVQHKEIQRFNVSVVRRNVDYKHLFWRLKQAYKENHTISTAGSGQSRIKYYKFNDCIIFVSQRHQIVDSDWQCIVGIRRKDKHPNKWLNLSLISLTNGFWHSEMFLCEKTSVVQTSNHDSALNPTACDFTPEMH